VLINKRSFVPSEPHFDLKRLSHAILGNFSTDQIFIELTKITAQNYGKTQTKHRKAKEGDGWIKLECKMDCM